VRNLLQFECVFTEYVHVMFGCLLSKFVCGQVMWNLPNFGLRYLAECIPLILFVKTELKLFGNPLKYGDYRSYSNIALVMNF
jgi:hypothetical protein